MDAMGPMQLTFARVPVCSYFDEPQKNEIYFLNDYNLGPIRFINVIVSAFSYGQMCDI